VKEDRFMNAWRTWLLVSLAAILIAGSACRKKPPQPVQATLVPERIQSVRTDVGQWFDAARLTPEQKRVLDEFSQLLAIALEYDALLGEDKRTSEDLVRETQPIIDRIAKAGEPAESMMVQLLDKRKGLTGDERRALLTQEHVEVYAAIILWNMKSKRAVPVLKQLAPNKDIQNRAIFYRALGRIGDPEPLTFLRGMTRKETDSEVQQEIRSAIQSIEQQNPPAPSTKPQ
jgi:hypothetical protein